MSCIFPVFNGCGVLPYIYIYIYPYTPLKTNISPEKWWLEDVFPIEIVPFLGDVNFQGCISTSKGRNIEVRHSFKWILRVSFRKTYAFVYFFGYRSFWFISVVFHMRGYLFVAKLVGWEHPNKNSLMSLQLEVILEPFQRGLTSLQARFLRIRRIASTSFWQAFPIILVWSRSKPVVSGGANPNCFTSHLEQGIYFTSIMAHDSQYLVSWVITYNHI